MATNKKPAAKTAKGKKSGAEKHSTKSREVHAPTHAKCEDKPVTIDRRASMQKDRRTGDRRQKSMPVAVERRACERRVKVNRRRQIDPTTCERDYSIAEIEFMNAVEEYKRTSGRMFPTCSEILEVLQKLGYEKQATPVMAPIAEATITPELTPSLTAI